MKWNPNYIYVISWFISRHCIMGLPIKTRRILKIKEHFSEFPYNKGLWKFSYLCFKIFSGYLYHFCSFCFKIKIFCSKDKKTHVLSTNCLYSIGPIRNKNTQKWFQKIVSYRHSHVYDVKPTSIMRTVVFSGQNSRICRIKAEDSSAFTLAITMLRFLLWTTIFALSFTNST